MDSTISRDLEKSIKDFEKSTSARKLQLAFKDGITLDHFVQITTLGTGTFGKVKLVKLKKFPEIPPLALKMLKKKTMIELKQVDHVKSEKTILQRISHPFITELKQSFQDRHYVYMLLDYVCGGELFNRLRREGRFANDVALFYLSEILLAFQYLHSMDIAYRDLKPENLLIDREGHVRLTDFGFSKTVKDKTYTLCGTPEYLAPEIIKSKGHDKSADWWAFGILMFEMLAGYPPFYDDNPMGIYKKIVEGYYEIPVIIRPSARDLIQRFLRTDIRTRIGCSATGVAEIKAHRWLRGVDWNLLYSRKIATPWIPNIQSELDTHYFDKYPEKPEKNLSIREDQQRLFKDFL